MPPTSIACYCRVSTEDQQLNRQIEATQEFARNQLDADLIEIDVYRDKATGTDTIRDGYKTLMQDVEAGEIGTVVVKSVSRISRSIRDLDRTVDRITTAGVELHIIDEGLEFVPAEEDPFQKAMFRLLGVFAQLEAEMAQKRTKEGIAARQQNDDYHHGPAPLGFHKNDGKLVENDDYDKVVAALEMVQKDNLSKRKAANELNTSRTTIRRAIGRTNLYGL